MSFLAFCAPGLALQHFTRQHYMHISGRVELREIDFLFKTNVLIYWSALTLCRDVA